MFGIGPNEAAIICVIAILLIGGRSLRSRYGDRLPWLFKSDEQLNAERNRSIGQIVEYAIVAGFAMVGFLVVEEQLLLVPVPDNYKADYVRLFLLMTGGVAAILLIRRYSWLRRQPK